MCKFVVCWQRTHNIHCAKIDKLWADNEKKLRILYDIAKNISRLTEETFCVWPPFVSVLFPDFFAQFGTTD